MNKKALKYLVRFLFSVVILFLVVRVIDLQKVKDSVILVPWYVYAFSLILNVFRIWLMGLRWKLINPDVTDQISNWQYFKFSMISSFYNLIMPGALGGDIAKSAYVLNHVKSKRSKNLISIIVDRFIGLISVLFIGVLSLLLIEGPIKHEIKIVAFLFLIASLLAAILSTNYHFLNFIKKLTLPGKVGVMQVKAIIVWDSCLSFYRHNNKKILGAFLITLPLQTVSLTMVYIWAVFLNINVSFMVIAFTVSLVWLITTLPISIGGVGVRELSFVYFLGLYGVNTEQALALSAVKYLFSIVAGVFSLFFIITPNNPPNDQRG